MYLQLQLMVEVVQHRVYIAPRQVPVSQQKLCGIKSCLLWVGRYRSKERDRKSELVLRSTYQIFEWDRNNSDRNFYNVVRYVHIPLVP